MNHQPVTAPRRKRDRLRSILVRSNNGSPPAPVPAPAPQSSIARPTTILDRALERLTEGERTVLTPYLQSGSDVGHAVDLAYEAAIKCKTEADAKDWRWNFRGRTVIVREEAEKVLRWIDRFKAVGDVVANVDPLHIGLPWAGVRLILEVATAETRQMEAIVTGLELSLDMASRLDVHVGFHRRLPKDPSTDVFGKELVKTYAEVLRFLSRAIGMLRKGATSRLIGALWHTSDLVEFADKCDDLGRNVESTAQSCHRELQYQEAAIAQQWRLDLNNALHRLNDIRDICGSLEKLHIKVDLSCLTSVEGATFDSFMDSHNSRCLAGTRVQLLQDIDNWSESSQSKSIFWLCGKAGVGKSTIARTVAHNLNTRRRLGASFFFNRGEGDRAHAQRFFATIARQLADKVPGFASAIASALESDSLLGERNLQTQFEGLLLQPLRNARQSPFLDTTIVVDALDECADAEKIKTIVILLAQLGSDPSIRVQIFITSRPDLPIRLGFRKVDGSLHQDIILEQVQASSIDGDLDLYFRDRFREIREQQSDDEYVIPQPVDWPGDEIILRLVNIATPLFIVAFTLCRYMSGSQPHKRLSAILNQQQSRYVSGLDMTYGPILEQIITGLDLEQQEELIADFKEIVGTIILLADSLSIKSLGNLLDLEQARISYLLRRLNSVLDIDNRGVVRLFHLSFREFLLNQKLEEIHRFQIDQSEVHQRIYLRCLSFLSRPKVLRRNICHVEMPGTRRAVVSQASIAACISPETSYACKYWSLHLRNSANTTCDNGPVHIFLKKHFLHWAEAMTWQGRLWDMSENIEDIIASVDKEQAPGLSAFLYDARRFLAQHRSAIDLAPLQIYLSALFFSPSKSIIRRTFKDQGPFDWLCIQPEVPLEWDAEYVRYVGHCDRITRMAVSPNGSILASLSVDQTLRLWNTKSGQETHKSCFDGSPVALAFSPCGEFIASATTKPSRVHITNVFSSKQPYGFDFSESRVIGLAFAPDGHKIVVCGPCSMTLWSLSDRAAERLRTYRFPTRSRWAIITSVTDNLVELVNNEGFLLSWNIMTNITTCDRPRPHLNSISGLPCVLQNNASCLLAGMEGGRTLNVWNLTDGNIVACFNSSDRIVAFAVSPCGSIIAIAHNDGTVRLSSVKSSRVTQKLKPHKGLVHALLFSPDGLSIISAGASDHVMLSWAASTHIDQAESDSTLSADNGIRNIVSTIYDTESPPFDESDVLSISAVSPDRRYIAVNSSSGLRYGVWDIHTATVALRFGPDGNRPSFHIRAFLPCCKAVVANGVCSASIWDLTDSKILLELPGDYIRAAELSDDRQYCVTGSSSGVLALHRVTATSKGTTNCHGDIGFTIWRRQLRLLDQVALSRDGTNIASLEQCDGISVWNANTGARQFKLSRVSGPIRVPTLAFSPEGQHLNLNFRRDSAVMWTVELPIGRQAPRNRSKMLQDASEEEEVLVKGSQCINADALAVPMVDINESDPFTHDGDWIKYRSQDLLWLPPEYRSMLSRMCGTTLIFIQSIDEAIFLKFDNFSMELAMQDDV